MKRLWKVVTVVVCIVPIVAVARQKSSATHEAYLQSLVEDKQEFAPPSYDLAKNKARNQRARQLYSLWLVRDQRNVVDDVTPFLQDEDEYLRDSAARVLARLENSDSDAKLQQISDGPQGKTVKTPNDVAQNIEPMTLKLSLARARSRGLRGRAKVTAFARGVELSFDDIIDLSRKVNGDRNSIAMGTTGDRIVRETVDLLYEMGKKGDDIQPLADQLSLNAAQRVKIQAARLSVKQEVELIFDYLSRLNVVTGDDSELCERHLASLGPKADDMIIQRLNEMQEHPDRFPDTDYATRHASLFMAAALTGDMRAIPMLKYFEQDPNTWMRHYALLS